ncbi:MAG: hypothetical protein II922_04530 [Succinimonas sp.]|nr:hypothetical protein [Succinimonas sp.]
MKFLNEGKMSSDKIDEQTHWLFNRTYGVSSKEQRKETREKVKQQISEFGWENTFESWKNYLFTECKTPESAINFANLFWSYGGHDYTVIEPYKFLGYFYYRIDFDAEKYDELGILDSLAIDLLPKAGYSYADRLINDDYIPELDPKIIAQVEIYKSSGI